MLLGSVLFAGGLLLGARTVSAARGHRWVLSPEARARWMIGGVAVALLSAIGVSLLDPAALDVFERAFGPWLTGSLWGRLGVAAAGLLAVGPLARVAALALFGRPIGVRDLVLTGACLFACMAGWIAFAAWRGTG